MANRLARETSPYLRQHKDNPVDWYPWAPEALARARSAKRPILVSIGYSACHWCHVMARESFEDAATAAYMNAHFVCVKVDREERPDIDAIYTDACHAMTGRAGWPLNAFLTPAQVPFFAGTYFPREARAGLPAWRTVMERVVEVWHSRRFQIELGADRIVERLAGAARLAPSQDEPGLESLARARLRLGELFDCEEGGFGEAPKFPPASAIEFLLAAGETEMTSRTLRAMAAGGINDQIGGGFSRYVIDRAWMVPHFEKMLYDNALLARAYLHGWLVLRDRRLREVCCETLDWALREMRGEEGGFASSLDADSEGVEGRYYTWTVEQLRAALGEDADEAIAWFGATPEGNFEGTNVLFRAPGTDAPAERLAQVRRLLAELRDRRAPPGRDDKRLTAWNALMIGALAEAGAVLERDDYLAGATACAEFILRDLREPGGRLLRTYMDGTASLNAYLEDHAFLIEALVALYQATFEPRWFQAAREIADAMIERFADDRHGGFFETAVDHEQLVARRKDLHDTPLPAGNSSAALGLLRLAALTGEAEYERQAEGVLRLTHELAREHPQSFGHVLQALQFRLADVREVALVGVDTRELERVVRARHRPFVVLAGGEPDGVPLLAGRAPVDGQAAAYVCEGFACRRPATVAAELEAMLE
ncbi:MAG TPA: thioredoxin domain-containing protein [Solirubrobacteraceae bacterium]|nr:thioredoxin domain-containing protein [Solirubrobacteraceae bacterium]